MWSYPEFVAGASFALIGTLGSDNGDVHENVAENRLHIISLFSRLFQGAQLLKRRKFRLGLKRRDRVRILT